MPFIPVSGGVALWCDHFVPAGVAGGRLPLLLLAGQAMDSACWAGTVAELGDRRPLILLHQRGVGRSGAGFRPGFGTRDFARDVAEVLAGLGVPRAHVYGQSMGGRIAQWLAVDHPGRVAGLVLASTTAGDRVGVPRPAAITRTLLHDPDARAELFASPAFCRRHPDRVARLSPATTDPVSLRAHFRASHEHDCADHLAAVRAPTLVVHGTDDVVCAPRNAQVLAEAVPGARVRYVPGGRHGFHVEFPATARWVEAFVSGVEESGP